MGAARISREVKHKFLSQISVGRLHLTVYSSCPVPRASLRLQTTRSLILRARRSCQSSVQVLIQRHPTKVAPLRRREYQRPEAVMLDHWAHLALRSRATLSRISTGWLHSISGRPSPVLYPCPADACPSYIYWSLPSSPRRTAKLSLLSTSKAGSTSRGLHNVSLTKRFRSRRIRTPMKTSVTPRSNRTMRSKDFEAAQTFSPRPHRSGKSH